ncbi:MAG: hypothetical protein AAF546_05735 [Verrucomicrobiota bacterium]
MNRTEIFSQIDEAIASRSSLLKEHLNPGLLQSDRRFKKLTGYTRDVIDWYAWHNGTSFEEIKDGDAFIVTLENLALIPDSIYKMIEFSAAYGDLGLWNEMSEWNEVISELAGRYFPLLWDGNTSWLSVCIDPTADERPVGFVEFESDEAFEKAYDSFDEFLLDVLHSNKENVPLRCLE